MTRFTEFVANHPMLFLGLAAILGLIVWTELRRLTRRCKDLSPADAVLLMNHEDALVVDTREDAEARQGKIRGAKHLPMSVFKQRVGELDPYRGRPVIVVCRSGARSVEACEILYRRGFEKVYNLAGGMLAWENAGLPKSKK